MTALRLRSPTAGSLEGAFKRIQQWQIWALPTLAQVYIVAVTTLAAAVAMVTGLHVRWHPEQAGIFCGLVACGIVAIESTRNVKEVHGTLVRDLQPVWFVAIAVVLPPFYALAAPVPLLIHKLWRKRGMVVYRRVFSNATLSLAYGCAAWGFHSVPAALAGTTPGTGTHVLTWTAVVAGGAVSAWAINIGLLLVAMRMADRGTRVRTLFGSRDGLVSDMIELTLGTSLALVVAINPILMALALPSVVLYRRYLMQSQLVTQARLDAKTGLLNAGTWRREAEVEFFRARRTGAPLALIMIDVDHFRTVNETAGIPAGDEVLRSISRTLVENVYGQGVVGRVGGEEFAILLPGSGLAEARHLGERVRDHIAGEPIAIENGNHAGFVFRLTVSIGIAVLTQARHAFAELLTGADVALAEAKSTGRNRVCTDPAALPAES